MIELNSDSETTLEWELPVTIDQNLGIKKL